MNWKSIKTDLPTVDTEVLVKMHKPDIIGQYVVAKLHSDNGRFSPKSSMWIANRNSYIGVGNNSYAFDEWTYIG